MRAALCAVVLLSGCAALPSLATLAVPEDDIEISPPGEDGTRYVAVRSGRRAGAGLLERKWTRLAEQACEGDYMRLSDGQSEQRRAGVVVSRTHEGFVRCLLPEAAEGMSQQDARAREAAERRVEASDARPRRAGTR